MPSTTGIVTSPGGGAFGKLVEPVATAHHSTSRSRVGAGFSSAGMKMVNWPNRTPCLRRSAARVLVQLLDLVGDRVARHDPERLDQPEAEAARQPGQGLVLLHPQQRLEQRRDLAVDEMLQPAGDLLGHLGAGLVVDEGLRPAASARRRPSPACRPRCSPHISPPCSVKSISVSGAL